MRVLIGEISSYKAIVIARYIKQYYPTLHVVGYDNKCAVSFIHSKYVDNCVCIAYKSFREYIENIANYIQDNNIDIFIPVHSDYIGEILKCKDLFGKSLDYLGEYSDYIRLHEKNQLMQIARELHIDTPREYLTLLDAQVPFVIKPNNLSSAKGVEYFINEKDKNRIVALPTEMICQEYIKGIGCGYEVYCKNGEIVAEYGHIRLAEWPITGGSSVLRDSYIHPNMRNIVEKILKQVQWTGFAMFEFKVTDENRLVLIEVNPRIWGSINQALQNGCNLFSDILGAPLYVKDTNTNIRTCLSPHVWLAMFAYALKGRVDILKDFVAHYKNTYSDISLWNDPKGVASIIIRKLL